MNGMNTFAGTLPHQNPTTSKVSTQQQGYLKKLLEKTLSNFSSSKSISPLGRRNNQPNFLTDPVAKSSALPLISRT
jgi:hypothetical protein